MIKFKKLLAIALLAFVIALFLASCSKKEVETADKSENQQTGQTEISQGISEAEQESDDLNSETIDGLENDLGNF